MNGVFQTTSQALHVAHLVLSCEPRQKSALRDALIQLLESLPDLTRRQRDWLDQLYGEPSGTVDFGGLTGDEIRAQCAEVISAVRSKLPEVERWAVTAKYGQTMEKKVDGVRRFYFLAERTEAIHQLAKLFAPEHTAVASHDAMICLIAKILTNHSKADTSYRELAKSFGANHMTYARAAPKIKGRIFELEHQAISRLEPYFIVTGLVEPHEEQEAA